MIFSSQIAVFLKLMFCMFKKCRKQERVVKFIAKLGILLNLNQLNTTKKENSEKTKN